MSRLSILFICVGNMCRSPMAEAIARHLGDGRVSAHSAGLSPAGAVHAFAVSALEELGFSAAGLRSKGLEALDLEEMDVVVSLIGPHGLRYLPGGLSAELLAWSIADPVGEDEEMFFATARLLAGRIRELLDDLLRDAPVL
jgi:arsenate reductase